MRVDKRIAPRGARDPFTARRVSDFLVTAAVCSIVGLIWTTGDESGLRTCGLADFARSPLTTRPWACDVVEGVPTPICPRANSNVIGWLVACGLGWFIGLVLSPCYLGNSASISHSVRSFPARFWRRPRRGACRCLLICNDDQQARFFLRHDHFRRASRARHVVSSLPHLLLATIRRS